MSDVEMSDDELLQFRVTRSEHRMLLHALSMYHNHGRTLVPPRLALQAVDVALVNVPDLIRRLSEGVE